MKNSKNLVFVFLFLLAGLNLQAQEDKAAKIKKLVFEGALIEGQMGAINALIVTSDRRPEFEPMALQLAQKNLELSNVSRRILETGLYSAPFPVNLSK